MATEIGVRELRNNVTKIVKQVREEQAEYIVTVHGRPAAILRPITPEDEEREYQARVEAYLAEMDVLSESVGRAWKSGLSAVEAVEEQRREY
jgi:prevent-host-death family protein